MRTHFHRALCAATVVIASATGLVASRHALARQVEDAIADAQEAAMDMYSDALTRGDAEGFIKVLGLKPDQRQAVLDLFTAYRGQYDTATKKIREYQKSLQEKSGGGYDPKVWAEAGPVYEQYSKHTKKLKESFLEDLKAMVPPDLMDNWVKIERRVRRKEGTRTAMFNSARADLVSIVEGVMGNDPLPDELKAAMDRYEEDIDRSMNEMAQFRKELEAKQTEMMKDMANKDAAEMQKMQLQIVKQMNEKSRKAAEVNTAAFKKLTPLVPENKRNRFQVAYYKSAYSMMEGMMPGQASLTKAVDKATKLSDCTGEQKQQIEATMEEHDKELLGVYEKYAQTMDKKMEEGSKSDDPTAVQQMYFDQTAWMDLSTKKGEADRKAVEKLRAILTPEQLAQLPAPLKKVETAKPTFDE